MSQPTDHDFSTASGASGTTIRTDRNEMLAGILTKLSATTAPTTTFPFMWWIDTSQTPPEWNLRNAADSAWLHFANIDATTGIEILNEGAAVLGLANTADFTESQRIKTAAAAASWTITTDLDTGLASFIDLGGENAANEEFVGVSIDHRITSNVDGSESSEADIGVMRLGTVTNKITIGDEVTVSAVLNATTLEQGGTTVASLIETEKGSFSDETESGAAVTVPTDLARGERNRFTGASASTWTINSGTAGDVYPVMNDGTADITFAAGGGVTIATSGLTLGQQAVCTVEYVTSTRVFIYGENT